MLLRRARPAKTLISLVPMIDVMLILLVFFMVTSSYLNLDMMPMVESAETTQAAGPAESATPLLIRIAADGRPQIRGQPLDADELTTLIRARLAENPLASVIVLPSGAATTQQLVTVMDMATQAGATRLRLIRLEPRP